jgi:predicted ribosomally synthesized peptide with SipW-like signal peptide
MKKIMGLTVSALMVMGLVGGGTWAFFSDIETSTGNTLAAGTLDLTINGGNDPVTLLNVSDIYPGGSGSNGTTLNNAGNIGGTLAIWIDSITNTESSAGTEFTGDSINGSSGELGSALELAMYIDVDQGGSFNAGDIGLKNDGTTYTPSSLDYQIANSYVSANWTDVYSGNMAAGDSDNFIILYQLPTGSTADNSYQGDSIIVDFTFNLNQ